MNNEDFKQKQLNFEFRFIMIPYLIFAVIILLSNIFYSQIIITMTFWFVFAYNLGLLFVAFVRHFKRTLILTAILTLLSGAAFFTIIYVFGLHHQIFG